MDKSNGKNGKITENQKIVNWLKSQGEVKSAKEGYESNFDWLMHQGEDNQPSNPSSNPRNPIGQSPRKNPFTRDKGDSNAEWLMNLGSGSTPAQNSSSTPAQTPSSSQSGAKKSREYESNFDWLMHQGEEGADENQGAGLHGVGEIKPLTAGRNATEYQDEVEQELASMEAIYTGGLESLQTVFSQQIEEMGAIQLIQNIIDQAEDLSDPFNEEVIYIKDTVDLSDPQEVLTELVDSAETLLDDMQIENLTETLSSQLEGMGLEDEGEFEGEEYAEPEEEEWGEEPEEEEIPEENYEANEAVSGSGATLAPEEQSFLDSHTSEVDGISGIVDLVKFLYNHWEELNNISERAGSHIMIYLWYKMKGAKGFTIWAEGDSHSDSGWIEIQLNGWDSLEDEVDDYDLAGSLLDCIDEFQTDVSIEVDGDYMFEQTKKDYSGPEEFFGDEDWQEDYEGKYGDPSDNDGDGWPDNFANDYDWYDDFEEGDWFSEEAILDEFLKFGDWKGLEPIIRDIFEHSKVEIHRENE